MATCAVLAVAVVAGATPTQGQGPAISGTPQTGATLTFTAGTYSPGEGSPGPSAQSHVWQRCDDGSGNGCAQTQNGGATYGVTGADLNKFVRAVETATDGADPPLVVASNSIGPVAQAPAAPVNTAPPSITGTPAAGQSLTHVAGAWTGVPQPTVTQEWLRCNAGGNNCNAVGSAPTYALTGADVGSTIRTRENASNASGNASATSGAVGPIAGPPQITAQPSLDNPTPVVGQVITANPGSATGQPAPSPAFAWQRCDTAGGAGCVATGGNSNQYATVPADTGKFVRVLVTWSNGVPPDAQSQPAVTSQVVRQAPTNTVPPALTNGSLNPVFVLNGNAAVAVAQPPGTWVASPAITAFGYQWERCASADPASCAPIAGATGQNYGLQQVDVGSRLRARVTATNGVAPDGVAFTGLSNQVAQAPTNIGSNGMQAPFITDQGPGGNGDGIATVGETLTGSSGVWFAFPVPTMVHQWQRCPATGGFNLCVNVGSPIQVAPQTTPPYTHTGVSNYAVTDADLGSRIRLVVTVANAIGQPPPFAAPESTLPVRGAPLNRADLPNGAPTLTDNDGQPARGETLTAVSGLWTGFWQAGQAPLALSHQWQRCPASGDPAGCANIDGPVATPLSPSGAVSCTATAPCSSASVFMLSDADLGSRIRVIVTATNAGGSVVAETAMTPVIVGAPIIPLVNGSPNPALLPTIAGTPQPGLHLAASKGSWSAFPNDNLTYEYQWLRCASADAGSCTPIAGATADTYAVVAGDVGSLIRIRVTAKNGVQPDGVALSAAAGPVTAPGGGTGGPGPDLVTLLGSVTSGDSARFTVTVRNLGSSAANGASVAATVDSRLTVVSATSTRGSCSGRVTCSLGSLAPLESGDVVITARAPQTGVYTFEAAAQSSNADVNPSNNTQSTSVFVTVSAPRSPTANSPTDPNGPGDKTVEVASNQVTAKLLAKRVGKTWVVDTKFSLVSGTAKLLLTVTPNGSTKRLAFLKGSRLGTSVAKKTQKSLSLNAPKPATFPVRIVMPAKGFSRTSIYVIRIKATAPNGLSSSLDIGFSGSRIVGRSTVVAKLRAKRVGSTWVLKTTSPLVPAKARLQVWVTPNGTMGRSLTLLKGSRSGAAAIPAKGKQLTVRVAKAARLPVAVVLPLKGLSAKKTYVLRMRTIDASGPLAQVDLGFRTAAPPVAARAAAR